MKEGVDDEHSESDGVVVIYKFFPLSQPHRQFRPFHNYLPLVRCRSRGYSFFHKEGECPICVRLSSHSIYCTLTKTLPCFCHPERSKTAISCIRGFAQSKGSSFIKVSAQPTAFFIDWIATRRFYVLGVPPRCKNSLAMTKMLCIFVRTMRGSRPRAPRLRPPASKTLGGFLMRYPGPTKN